MSEVVDIKPVLEKRDKEVIQKDYEKECGVLGDMAFKLKVEEARVEAQTQKVYTIAQEYQKALADAQPAS